MINKPAIKVLNVTTYNEDCGVAKFQANIQECFNKYKTTIHSDIYQYSLNHLKKQNNTDRRALIKDIVKVAAEYDVVHIQHEFGLFYKNGVGFGEIVQALKRARKQIFVTIHTAPSHVLIQNQRPPAYAIRSSLKYLVTGLKNKRLKKKLLYDFRLCDRLITLNRNTREELVGIVGITPERIFTTILPVRDDVIIPDNEIRKIFPKNTKLIVINGFINHYKGFDKAIRALSFLPEEYRLVIAGGINPDSGNPADMDAIGNLIAELQLTERVHITGYIEGDSELQRLVSGCDVAIYPYDINYYRLASSAAVGVAINAEVPAVAFPAESFKEINDFMEGVLTLTQSSTYFELAQKIPKTVGHDKQILKDFKRENSYKVYAERLLDIYNKSKAR